MKSHILVKRELRNLRTALRDLVASVITGLAALDQEMTKPSTPERGKNIAKISNFIQFANDQARYFALHQKL